MSLTDKASQTLKTVAIDDIDLDDDQKQAIARCTDMSPDNPRIVPVTGPAGTGKTTIISVVYTTLVEAGYSVALCAPTGKAAKRIYEATGIPAVTIHRLLEYPHPGERDEKTGKALESTVPKRDKMNPLSQKVVIADEYAMVNTEVHSNLVHALPSGGRLIMFGDANQLRPIETHKLRKGKPSPFEVALQKFNGVWLTHIHRQGAGSGIAANGQSILAGRVPKRFDDFDMKVTASPVRVIEDMARERTDLDYSTVQHQILSPTKKSWVGTYKLNVMLQGIYNPDARALGIDLPRHKWDNAMPIRVYVGDKVIWTENSYDLRDEFERWHEERDHVTGQTRRTMLPVPPNKMILNGETGIITEITPEGGITLDVGDRIVDIPHVQVVEDRKGSLVDVDPRKRMDLAYCITVHKAQGSEYESVVYVLNKSTFYMQCRPNFYTAITRASKHVTVVTDQRSLQNSVMSVQSAMDRKDMQR